MSKSIYINDMRRDIDEGGGGGGATSADQVSYNGGTVKGALDTVRGDLNTFQFRMNEGSGEYKLESEGADSWRPFKSGATMELLWENPSPTSEFAPQTLNIDWSKYKYLIIKNNYKDIYYSTSIKTCNFITDTGLNCISAPYLFESDIDDGKYGLQRVLTVSEDKKSLAFGNAYQNGGLNNGGCVPLAIYGIR